MRIAGAVIARQRPGTAKGFVFLSLEDETGIANAIITPQTFRARSRRGGAAAISADRRQSAKSGKRDFGEGRTHSAVIDHARANHFARFSLILVEDLIPFTTQLLHSSSSTPGRRASCSMNGGESLPDRSGRHSNSQFSLRSPAELK